LENVVFVGFERLIDSTQRF